MNEKNTTPPIYEIYITKAIKTSHCVTFQMAKAKPWITDEIPWNYSFKVLDMFHKDGDIWEKGKDIIAN